MKTLRWCAALGFVLFFVASCDNHNEDMEDVHGTMMSLDVHIVGVRDGGMEEVMRSASVSPLTGRREIAMISQPIGDNMLLDMSLEPNETAPLRAIVKVLEDGKRFRVVALKHSDGTYVSHGDYAMTATGGVSKASGDLHVPVGNVSYDYICISYNSTATLPAASFTVGQAPANLSVPTDGKDFLYNKVTKTISNVGEATLSFTLVQKLSRVTLVVDGTYNGWNITAITANRIRLAPFYASATMKLQDGSMTKGSPATNQYFTWPTISAAQTQTSNPRTVFTNNETLSLIVPANSITINGASRPNAQQTISFPTLSSLVQGYDYTLRLRLRIPRWAGSNIYWSGNASSGKLTFDLEGTTTRQGYQGVYFRFGSLVGIAPSGSFSTSTPIYIPDDSKATKWAPTTVSAAGYSVTWTETAEDVNPGSVIPYLDGRYKSSVDDDRGDVYVLHPDRNTVAMYAAKRGDICQYLGTTDPTLSGYRLPMSNEWGTSNSLWDGSNPTTTPVAGGWVKGIHPWPGGSNGDGNEFGTVDLINTTNRGWVKNTTMGNVVLPASGRRLHTSGAVSYVGGSGNYWSGSAKNAISGYYLDFFNSDVYTANALNRSYAFSVRCVKK
jgi:uncharacterized protein (TIGR02145 family)